MKFLVTTKLKFDSIEFKDNEYFFTFFCFDKDNIKLKKVVLKLNSIIGFKHSYDSPNRYCIIKTKNEEFKTQDRYLIHLRGIFGKTKLELLNKEKITQDNKTINLYHYKVSK